MFLTPLFYVSIECIGFDIKAFFSKIPCLRLAWLSDIKNTWHQTLFNTRLGSNEPIDAAAAPPFPQLGIFDAREKAGSSFVPRS